jgi:RNA polymerase sigma factor (sigma-70 family)
MSAPALAVEPITSRHIETTRPDQAGNRPRTLRDLLGAASASDPRAWQEIIRRFVGLVLHTARMHGLSHADAADVAQLTWLRLYENVDRIREPDCLPAWLVSTARRESIRLDTKARKYVLCAEPYTEYGEGAVTDDYPTDGGYEPATELALASLPTRYQTLLRLLTADEDLSYLDISRIMDVPVGSIGPMRMRALRLLAQVLPRPDGVPYASEGSRLGCQETHVQFSR